MVRRYLGLSFSEWDALPWYQQRVYMEEWNAEQRAESEEDPAPSYAPVIEGPASTGELAALGIKVEAG